MIATFSRLRAAHAVGWFAVVLGLTSALVAPAAGAGAASQVQITAPNGSAISGGGSETTFSVRTPDGAKCPGDTQHDFYFVYSYFLPRGTSPTAVTFKGEGLPSQGFGIVSDGAFFGPENTAPFTGQIVTLPLHAVWGRVSPKMLFPNGEKSSVWETGLVCADTNGAVHSFWNAELRFNASASDSHGFTWTILSAATPAHHPNRTGLVVSVLIVVVLAVALTAWTHSRRPRAVEAQR
jgi:hypothetical protein